ncbi:LPS export ABC transporter permease LptF [Entomomonas asaccharolytica]|uniref:Lipopolysaccharide export system permease protein LptF n=1 Tax=Entomomonas asaccharolytica TaxID=2785331 RepID=A0A974RXW4_9GAMM|nr:LPS export ABC transporter permease LptF [Entomomonas asaccharolytica]QQP86630.1 LPS export ABC transporter permease LptF [Entomomonas asaccharolytica]
MIVLRYLTREILVTLSAISSVLLIIIMSGRFTNYLKDAAQGGIDPSILLWIMWYRLPDFLYLILPLGLFLGILLAYGRMYLDSEMVILTSSGISIRKIFAYTLLPTAIITLIVIWLCFSLGPAGMNKFRELVKTQDSMTEFSTLIPGHFQSFEKSDGNTKTYRVTYTESMSNDKKHLNNIFISQMDTKKDSNDHTTINVLSAKTGQIEIQPDNSRYLILKDGYRYDGNPGQADYRVTEYKIYGILLPKPEINVDLKSNALTTTELIKSDKLEDRVELNWRFSMPILVIIIAMLAVPLAKVNPRQGRFFKLIPAIFLYMLYLGLLIAARGQMDKGKLSIWFFWVIHFIFLSIALILLYWDTIKIKFRKPQGVGI